jgi:hypothetical protein
VPVFALVAAGAYDGAALDKLLRQLRPDLNDVIIRLCKNDRGVTATYKNRLKDLRYANQGRPVDKAIVVRDTHGRGANEVMEELKHGYAPNDHPFPVEFAVVVPELEAWLIADHEARTKLSREIGGEFIQYQPLNFPPEQLPDPKMRLSKLLAAAGISYTSQVAAHLAELSNVVTIEQLCQSFTLFKRAAHNC